MGWTTEQVKELYEMPFMELIYQAHGVHREHFDPNEIQTCAIMSIKTGACPEDCAYCPQSGHYKTGLEREKLYDVDAVIGQAKKAKDNGATRFCMGAAWRNPPKKDFPKVLKMVKAVNDLGLESCVTLGMLEQEEVEALETVGLDYYNHNLDTSEDFYKEIITTRTYQDRLDTLNKLGNSKINVCCGGILGLGETRKERIEFLKTLANLPKPPKSVPINHLAPVKGTPLEHQKALDPFEFIRAIAVARILLPSSELRLSAGRDKMSEQTQALCFFAGANSIWYAQEKIFVTKNPTGNTDQQLFQKLGLKPRVPDAKAKATG